MRKKYIWVIIAIIVVAAGGWLYYGRKKTAATTYSTGTVTKGTLVVSVSASGTTTSANRTSVTTGVTGTVNKVYVKDGDTVRAGQTIMTVTLNQSGVTALASAKSALLQAQAALTSAQQNVNNSSTDVATATTQVILAQQQKVQLHQALVKVQSDLNAAQTAYDAVSGLAASDSTRVTASLNLQAAKVANTLAKSKYANADAAITQAKNNVTYVKQKVSSTSASVTVAQAGVTTAQEAYSAASGTITAPVAGTIGDLTYASGMGIAASSSGSSTAGASNASTKVASIITNSLPIATFSLAQTDEPSVQPGQKATLTFDALTDKTYTGTVIGVDRTGSVSSGVTTYPMTIQLDSANDQILPNMSVTADVITKTVADVLLVPSAAVKTSTSGSTVQVMNNGKPSTVTVTIGDSSDSQTVVLTGLTEGQTVVTATITPSTTKTANTSASSLFGGTTTRGAGSTRSFSGNATVIQGGFGPVN